MMEGGLDGCEETQWESKNINIEAQATWNMICFSTFFYYFPHFKISTIRMLYYIIKLFCWRWHYVYEVEVNVRESVFIDEARGDGGFFFFLSFFFFWIHHCLYVVCWWIWTSYWFGSIFLCTWDLLLHISFATSSLLVFYKNKFNFNSLKWYFL